MIIHHIFTHQKKSYLAICLRWNGNNTDDVINLIKSSGAAADIFNDSIMIRWQDSLNYKCSIETMYIGDWVRKGENNVLKIMKDPEFQLKYEPI